ncbi:MAG: cysteine hydrolase family protein [Alphaproteobacteria bacterium]
MPVLIIIDVQRGFINPATAHVPARVEALQGRYGTIVATRFVNPEGSAHRRLIGWARFAPGSDDTALAFTARADARIVEKHVYSCLTDEVRSLINAAGAGEVHLCGIATDNCVLASAIALFEAGYTPVVLGDACASHAGSDCHDWGLRILRRLIGAKQVR